MADVASKQQKTALFLSTIVTRTRRHTELTKKSDKPDGTPVLCQRIFSSAFRVVYLYRKPNLIPSPRIFFFMAEVMVGGEE